MKIETIQMDRTAAKRAFLEYRNAVRSKHSEEDAEIMRGYKALAKGQQLIKLSETITAGGLVTVNATTNRWDSSRNTAIAVPCVDRLPRLAIARASAQWCHLTINSERIRFDESEWNSSRAKDKFRTLPKSTLPDAATHNRYRAMVPPVPPRFRPSSSLENFHVLWEAEWQRQAPIDPALLRHIGGDLYAVLAIWDLTELERSVLMRRFQ